jgi:hypothetical protein
MDVREEISAYLENPEMLYKEWYIEHVQYETGIESGEEVGVLANWKKEFDDWVYTHISELRQIICPNTSKISDAVTQVDIVLEIMDIIEQQPYVGVVKMTATLLFLYGIDKLCEDYEA